MARQLHLRTSDDFSRAMKAIAIQLGRRWWQRHPVNAAVRLAQPAVAHLAAARPAALIAGAATVGAIAMLTKPWRLLSVTAVAGVVFKSSDVADWITLIAAPDKRAIKSKDERIDDERKRICPIRTR